MAERTSHVEAGYTTQGTPYVTMQFTAYPQVFLTPAEALSLGRELVAAAETLSVEVFLSTYLATLGLEAKDIAVARQHLRRYLDNLASSAHGVRHPIYVAERVSDE